MGSKRGVQVQLALARLERWNSGLVVWGLSATLGNLEEAMQVLLGDSRGVAVRGRIDKNLVIDTLLPVHPGRFSWGGHLGKQMQLPVVEEIERSATTLVFVNMRSQAEAWYQFILDARPTGPASSRSTTASSTRKCATGSSSASRKGASRRWSDLVARPRRGLPAGRARAPDRLGERRRAPAPARRPQRPRPGRASRITLVPTNTLELVEAVAARRAALAGRIEKRATHDKPFDVLVQHLVTIAIGGGSPPRRCTRK